jgi:hypothetical protein
MGFQSSVKSERPYSMASAVASSPESSPAVITTKKSSKDRPAKPVRRKPASFSGTIGKEKSVGALFKELTVKLNTF